MHKQHNGFSLIELLIVVAVILIIAAIAIPTLIRSKIAANEASAVASCRSINSAEIVYSSLYNTTTTTVIFSADLKSLGDGGTASNCAGTTTVPTSTAACLIDRALENATQTAKSGYMFSYTPATGSYSVTGAPASLNSTGVRYFFTDQSAVIRANSGAAASNNSSPI